MEGAIDDAIKDEKHALALRPSRYEAHATLAECLRGQERRRRRARRVGEGHRRRRNGPAGRHGAATRSGASGYGKLLVDHGRRGAALAQLLARVATAAEKHGASDPAGLLRWSS